MASASNHHASSWQSHAQAHAHAPAQHAEHNLQDQRLSPAPLAGPGTSRANRRLQLRKNGFRGRAVQEQRNITPSRPSSSSWSSAPTDFGALLDGASDSKMHERYDMEQPRKSSSNILQEVNNSSLRRKGNGRARMDPLVSIFHDENAEAEGDAYDVGREASWRLESSPACLPPDAPNLTKSKKKQQRSSSDMVRDAMLEEKDHYIEHLESQLAAAQTQLSSITSPTVTQARSLKMRALNSQIRSLQEELTEWETRYHERIQEELDEKNQVETNLKARVRLLEQDVETYAQNARDLQHQLEQTRNSLSAAESTSIELEKRLETFANIVATSPVKSEFNFTPFSETRRGHARRQSALPRFPTTGSLQLPINNRWSMPTPVLSTPDSAIEEDAPPQPTKAQPAVSQSAEAQPSSLTSTPLQPPMTNEVDFAYVETASKRDSMLSSASSRLSWTLPDSISGDGTVCASTGKARPSRKMRRFHAGSVMPKPLILSGTTHMNSMAVPATAPPLEDHDTPPSFPFPEVRPIPRRSSFDDSPLMAGRRRAHTIADGLTREDFADLSPLHDTISSPAQAPPSTSSSQRSVEADVLVHSSPSNETSESTPRDFSSLGSALGRSAIGRNLFEELRRAKTTESMTSSSDAVPGSSPPSLRPTFSSSSENRLFPTQSPSQLRQRRIIHHRSISEQTALPLRSKSRAVMGLPSLAQSLSSGSSGRSRTSTSSQSGSNGNRIVTVVSDLYHHPYLVARKCFLRGERLMLLSNGVGKLQWWLLSFLLGPMVCRRLVSTAQPLFSPKSISARTWRRECRRRRKNGEGMISGHKTDCPCHGDDVGESTKEKGLLERHSPWLWIKFSLTLAFAIGAAIKDGPGSLLKSEWGRDESECTCSSDGGDIVEVVDVENEMAGAGSVPTGSVDEVEQVEEVEKLRVPARRPVMERSASQRSLADELEDAEFEESEDEHEHEHEHDD